MSSATPNRILNEAGHLLIDAYHGRDTSEARENFNRQATQFQTIGRIAMIVSIVLATLCVILTAWKFIPCLLITLYLGHEVSVIGSNAKDLVTNSYQRFLALKSESAFNNKISEGTVILKCALKGIPEIGSNLYTAYKALT